MENGKWKLGIINVGQSPRVDNRSFVRNWFKAQGVDILIEERASYDGMTFEEIHALEGPDFDPNVPLYSPDTRCGAFVHCPDSWSEKVGNDFYLGKGWYEVWTPKKENVPRIQRCINELEAAGCDAIMLCCCLRYPTHAFTSNVPFVLPWKCTFNYVQTLADTMANPQVGIVIGRGQNWERDIAMWTDYDGFRNVDFHFGVGHCTGGEEVMLDKKLDLVVVWGYHTFDYRDGKIGDEECLELKYEKEFGCPVISSASATFLTMRGFARPVIDEKSYYAPVSM